MQTEEKYSKNIVDGEESIVNQLHAYEEQVLQLKKDATTLKSSEVELKKINRLQKEEIGKLKSDLESILHRQQESGASAIEGM